MHTYVSNSFNNPPVYTALPNTFVQAGNILNTTINTSDTENNIITISASGSPFVLSTANFPTVSSTNATGNFSWTTSCSDIRRQNPTVHF